MATYVAGYINDLSGVKDNIKLRVRISSKMQATVRMALVNGFKQKLQEGCAVTLSRPFNTITGLHQEQDGQFDVIGHVVASEDLDNYDKNGRSGKKKQLTLADKEGNEMRCTLWGAYAQQFSDFVDTCANRGKILLIMQLCMMEIWDGKMGVQNRYNGTKLFLFNGNENVIGHVVASEDLDNYDKNGRSGKKKQLTLADKEGNEMRCTLWGAYAQQFSDFVDTCANRGKILLIMQLCMMEIWDGKMGVQNRYNGTKLFLFNGNESIPKEEFMDVELYRLSYFAAQDDAKSENTASRISTQSKHSTRDEFLNKLHVKNIVKLLDVDQGKASVIVGTIIAIHEEEGWWYLGCRKCNKKVVKESQFVDLEAETKPKFGYQQTPDQWTCTKCDKTVTGIKTEFRLQIRVQDESGTISLSLFNDEVQAMVGRSAYQLCDKYGCKNAEDQIFPKEITNLVGKKYAFKVAIDQVNAKKLLPVFTVLRLTADAEIINSIVVTATPVKDTEATSSANPVITPFMLGNFGDSRVNGVRVKNSERRVRDLESQTNENTTPVQKQKSAKRASDGEPESDGSSIKKPLLEIKMEKAGTQD
ncbi:nucleic acid-binding, OB-fold protein [Artemisia annua]|uniref:Nucleic acid-binding, OB-fold protein n=1 Tax=Artemisia annua TaxID=35608 RepID=A0A2U1QAY7_ARTAN|nr:nucleic acid-binding, OB-fold protein [Artemisia annua]